MLPIDPLGLVKKIERSERKKRSSPGEDKLLASDNSVVVVEDVLQALAAQALVRLERRPQGEIVLVSTDTEGLLEAYPSVNQTPGTPIDAVPEPPSEPKRARIEEAPRRGDDELSLLLNAQTVRDRELSSIGKELESLIKAPTAKDELTVEQFKTKGGTRMREHCPQLTRQQCNENRMRNRDNGPECDKLHYLQVILPYTDIKLGNCSYLNQCRRPHCKHIHYQPDPEDIMRARPVPRVRAPGGPMYPAQQVDCDVRDFKFEILGDFPIIMADPPWDIHMSLPYGTLTDDEMVKLPIQCLQTDGVLMLWVTGRAMELGRHCFERWGYRCVGELIWVKTNQLQRLIRTGRTGHWLNHTKEHCLVGVKGKPMLNNNIDCDVIVAEVRETSRKPDEVYGVLERLMPGTRKLEIFGRKHNTRPGWITVGNQLGETRLSEPDVIAKFQAAYPERDFVAIEQNGKESRVMGNKSAMPRIDPPR